MTLSAFFTMTGVAPSTKLGSAGVVIERDALVAAVSTAAATRETTTTFERVLAIAAISAVTATPTDEAVDSSLFNPFGADRFVLSNSEIYKVAGSGLEFRTSTGQLVFTSSGDQFYEFPPLEQGFVFELADGDLFRLGTSDAIFMTADTTLLLESTGDFLQTSAAEDLEVLPEVTLFSAERFRLVSSDNFTLRSLEFPNG